VTDDGATTDALLSVTRPEANHTVTLEVDTATAKPNAKPVEYVVGFAYHS